MEFLKNEDRKTLKAYKIINEVMEDLDTITWNEIVHLSYNELHERVCDYCENLDENIEAEIETMVVKILFQMTI